MLNIGIIRLKNLKYGIYIGINTYQQNLYKTHFVLINEGSKFAILILYFKFKIIRIELTK